jgi:uncharacterized RmlC-like cupin family protein
MQPSLIRVVRPDQFDSATAQTPKSKRTAAIYPGAGIGSPMWGGLFLVEPGAHTGIHHHGEQHTIAYVLSGACYVRWGDRGEFDNRASRRLSIRPGMASASGDQSLARRAIPLDCSP